MANGNYNIRRPYEEKLYVERGEEFNKAQAWKNSERRVLTVTSPPANGKTWFLNHFRQIIQKGDALTFNLDIRDFLYEGALGFREIDQTMMYAWLFNFAEQLHAQCSTLPPLNREAEVAAILNVMAKHMSDQCWPQKPIYLFVDGGDEPSNASWKKIEKEILEPIMAHPGWRLIIALRQSQRLYSHLLRKTEQPLELKPLVVNEAHPGHKQIDKLIQAEGGGGQISPSLETVLGMLPGYTWIHPGLNYFLFLEASTHYDLSSGIQIQPHLMERGVMALTALPDPQQIINWLIVICEGQPSDEWLIEDLDRLFGKSRREVWLIISTLQTHLLITNMDNRYHITDGVREFIRAAQSIS